jgi:HEAT repeat protein
MRPAVIIEILGSIRALPGWSLCSTVLLAAAVGLLGACSWGEPKSSGKRLSEHFELLKSPDPEIRLESARDIASLAERADLFNDYRHFKRRLPEMLEALKDPDSRVRDKIAEAFTLLTEPTPGAIPQLLELARNDPNHSVRQQAMFALARARADQMDLVLPFLIEFLEKAENECDSCSSAALTLKNIGTPAARAIPALVRICPRDDNVWCLDFHDALKRIDPNWHERPGVQPLLAETDWSMPGSQVATDKLTSGGRTLGEHFERLASPQDVERLVAASRILSLAGTAARRKDYQHFKRWLPEMLEALNDPNPEVRKSIAWTFSQLEEPTPDAIPQLLELARSDPDGWVRIHALRALQHARADQMDLVLPLLIELLRDRQFGERAVDVLRHLGPPAARAIPALVELCPVKSESFRCQSVRRTLERIDANWRERPEVQALLARLAASEEDAAAAPGGHSSPPADE